MNLIGYYLLLNGFIVFINNWILLLSYSTIHNNRLKPQLFIYFKNQFKILLLLSFVILMLSLQCHVIVQNVRSFIDS